MPRGGHATECLDCGADKTMAMSAARARKLGRGNGQHSPVRSLTARRRIRRALKRRVRAESAALWWLG